MGLVDGVAYCYLDLVEVQVHVSSPRDVLESAVSADFGGYFLALGEEFGGLLCWLHGSFSYII